MTDDKLYTSLSANTIMVKLTNHVQRTKLVTSSTDKHYSLDSEDDFRSGCRNVSHQQQFFSELPSPDHTIRTKAFKSYISINIGQLLSYSLCYNRPPWKKKSERACLLFIPSAGAAVIEYALQFSRNLWKITGAWYIFKIQVQAWWRPGYS